MYIYICTDDLMRFWLFQTNRNLSVRKTTPGSGLKERTLPQPCLFQVGLGDDVKRWDNPLQKYLKKWLWYADVIFLRVDKEKLDITPLWCHFHESMQELYELVSAKECACCFLLLWRGGTSGLIGTSKSHPIPAFLKRNSSSILSISGWVPPWIAPCHWKMRS